MLCQAIIICPLAGAKHVITGSFWYLLSKMDYWVLDGELFLGGLYAVENTSLWVVLIVMIPLITANGV